jgi:hypothetical protein
MSCNKNKGIINNSLLLKVVLVVVPSVKYSSV